MTTPSNPLRQAGLALLGLVAATSASGFVHILNPNTGLPTKWPPGPIPFLIMLGDSKTLTDGRNFNTSAQSAAQSWNAALGSVQFQTTLAQPAAATANNGVNEMVFASTAFGRTFPVGTVGLTTGSHDGNRITEMDIILNSTYTWDSYRGDPQPTIVDLRRVVLHELGHALGLDHSDQPFDSIMSNRTNSIESLRLDDFNGVEALYGTSSVPANNDFTAGTVYSYYGVGIATGKGFNTNATKQPGEPNHAGNNGGRSVWARWLATSPGIATVDTKGSYFDTSLAVYTGSSVSSLTEIASNDDIVPGVVQASSVTFAATAGTEYRFAVDGFNNDDGHGADSGGYTLNLSVTSTAPGLPTITTQPSSMAVTAGGNAAFSVVATGNNPLSYQWLFNASTVIGATSANLSLTAVTSAQAGTYSVVVTNPVGSVNSTGAILTVNAATPTPAPTTSSGGGGGGAPSLWFGAVLAVLGAIRLRRAVRV